MDHAFELMGVAETLMLNEEELREKFREAGKRVHPDAGGAEGDFAALREAYAILSSPSRRLRLWLERRGLEGDLRGSVGSELMDLFSVVGEVNQRAEALIRKRDEAKSALAKALLEHETHTCREAVSAAIAQVDALIFQETAGFQQHEDSAALDVTAAWQSVRSLAFLEKWKLSLRGCFARLS